MLIRNIYPILSHSLASNWTSEAERKLTLIKKLLGIIGILIPGRTRMRGMFLFEMQGTIAYLAKHSFDIGEIGKDEYLKKQVYFYLHVYVL